jgi:hypothetical protein
MVQVVLVAARGNGLKFFPHQGFLGLTPVRVEGGQCAKPGRPACTTAR